MTLTNTTRESICVYKPVHFVLPVGAVLEVDAEIGKALMKKGASRVVPKPEPVRSKFERDLD